MNLLEQMQILFVQICTFSLIKCLRKVQGCIKNKQENVHLEPAEAILSVKWSKCVHNFIILLEMTSNIGIHFKPICRFESNYMNCWLTANNANLVAQCGEFKWAFNPFSRSCLIVCLLVLVVVQTCSIKVKHAFALKLWPDSRKCLSKARAFGLLTS